VVSYPQDRSDNPLVSIAMPVFNGANTLDAAIRSMINQTYTHWELLLIDDGSIDSSASIARAFRDERIIVLADGKRMGHGPRLNQAIDLSQGRYVARMDQDDICFPERLAKQVEYLERHPEIDLLGTAALVFADGGSIKGLFPFRQSHGEICRRPWAGFYLAHPTWMGKATWFKKFRYGGQEALRAEDQDLLLRSYDSSRFVCLPEVLFGYRQNNLPVKSVLMGRRSLARAIVREALHRRKYGHIPLGILEQVAKGFTELMIVACGLERRLLRHRAIPHVDPVLVQRWQRIWEQSTGRDTGP
jgi:glycosyltransferase involved in cell wall biosynthesis